MCTPTFAPEIGGAETWTREVMTALGRRGHEIRVLAYAKDGIEREYTVGGMRVDRVQGGRLAVARTVIRTVAKQRPNVIIAQYSALPGAIVAARRLGHPAVAIVHDVYGLRESIRIKGPWTGFVRFAGLEQTLRALKPDAFLVPSQATADRLRPLAGRQPVTVVPVGVDHVANGKMTLKDCAQLVFVGRLVKQKGAHDLIEAIRRVRSRGRACRAVIVGEGPEARHLREAARDLGTAVEFVDALRDEELDLLIRRSLALVLPSTREGWGLVLTEAAARGTPYIAYDIPAVREQHQLVYGGCLVRRSVDALADAIERLLDDPGAADRIGYHGRRRVEHLTWDASAAVVEAALARALLSVELGGSER